MKKLLLIAGSVLLLSCTTSEELETSLNPESNSKEITSQNAKPTGAYLFGVDNVTLKCNGSSSQYNPISVNPNYPYVSSYEVLYGDLTPMYGRNQIRLSEFVAKNIWGYGGIFTSTTEVYIGNNAMNDFNNSNVMYSYKQDFTVSQDADNAAIYGSLFGTNGASMTNDAANTVYHRFKFEIDNLIAQNKEIVAVHLYTDGLLCIPSVRFIKMTVKVKSL
ncbi:hypothetical protein LF887_13850 [Chryseobacterium sp. MEBOG06]|uniref:hypothetical protein n=1 Tax=unclassified Chryseobacterium TaxID=2593645 RepID=UPI001F3BAF32|nr:MULTISPECIES: hypothetical protein [unclassified Chryseobacterium]UKB82090.1 hypothetical protein LF887_13850 [Chryseobacterium sp. MEBOG06]